MQFSTIFVLCLFFCQINSFVVTACRNRAFIVCAPTGISDPDDDDDDDPEEQEENSQEEFPNS
jgi:hypothetical protein